MLIKKDQNSEEIAKAKVAEDFDFLLQPGNYGFYERAEVTMIYIYGKTFPVTNLFTVVAFENVNISSNPIIRETERIKISKDLKIGIQTEYYSLNEIRNKFSSYIKENIWKDYDGELLRCSSEMKVLSKKFVPIDGTIRIPVNKVLKNNFFAGSYIIEFFDEKKEFISEIYDSKPLLLKIDDFLKYKRMNIDLTYMRDRLGNIIFQFPSELISFTEIRNENKDGVTIDLAWNSKLKEIPRCDLLCLSELDREIVGFGWAKNNVKELTNIMLDNSDSMRKTLIINSENNLILASHESMFWRKFEIKGQFSSAYSEPRIFNNNGLLEHVDLVSKDKDSEVERDYNYYLKERAFDEDRQHFKQFINDHVGAIKYIRKLIQKYDENGVYLWDPFLSSEDIINTLFYSNAHYVDIKAITSSEIYKAQEPQEGKTKFESWKETQIKELSNSGNLQGLNLEFRVKRRVSGGNFHDRFLIFPKKDHPIVYSLGSSINHIGEKHTIIVRVENAALIQNSFETLWNSLDSDECLIWRSK